MERAEAIDVGERLGSRIVVAGARGSGKTTLANELAARLGYKHVSLDSVLLRAERRPIERVEGGPVLAADRGPKDPAEVEADLRARLPDDHWVSDGQITSFPSFVWPLVTGVVWLDYPRRILVERQLNRARSHVGIFKRLLRAGGNYTKPWGMLLRLRHTLRVHGKNRATDDSILGRLKAGGCTVIRVTSDEERSTLIDSVKRPEEGEKGPG